MREGSTAAAKTKRTAANRADPRFAAFARLLARDLAKRHFEQEKGEKELKASPDGAYDSDSPPEGKS